MGRGPGTSRSCVQCRQRRKKCDLNFPCERCVKTGSECSGPIHGSTFIHRNSKNLLKQSDQAALTAALHARRTKQGRQIDHAPRPVSSSMTNPYQIPGGLFAIDNITSTIADQSIYKTLVEDFQSLSVTIVPRDACSSEGIPIYSTILGCIHALVSLASLKSRLLDLGIFSLLSLYIGKLRTNNGNQINLARSMYTQSIEELRQRIANHDHMLDDQRKDGGVYQLIFCLCLSLSLFDMVDQSGTYGKSLDPHIDGAASILLLNGPVAYSSPPMRAAFSCFRGIMIGRAIRKRQPTFLADAKWQEIPFRGYQKTDIERLHDVASRLPEILHRTDQITLWRVDGVMLPGAAIECAKLIQEYRDLRLKFETWYVEMVASCTMSTKGHLIEKNASFHAGGDEDDGFREILLFANSIPESKAGVLIHYWTLSLSLIIGVFDLFLATKALSYLEVKRALDLDSCRDTGCVMAGNILFATQKLSHDPERRLVLRMPLETTSLFMAKLRLIQRV